MLSPLLSVLPSLNADMGELYRWAGGLSRQECQRVMGHLSYRWRRCSKTLAEHEATILEHMTRSAELTRATRDDFHDQFQELCKDTWASAGNKNISHMVQTLLPTFDRASNALTLGKMTEAATRPSLHAGKVFNVYMYIFNIYTNIYIKISMLQYRKSSSGSCYGPHRLR